MRWIKQYFRRWFSLQYSKTSFQYNKTSFYLPQGEFKPDERCQGEAIVEQAIALGKPGRVYFRGSWYPARCCQNVVMRVGQRVLAIGRSGIEIVVEPFPQFHEDL